MEMLWFLWVGLIWREDQPNNDLWTQMSGLRSLATMLKFVLLSAKVLIYFETKLDISGISSI